MIAAGTKKAAPTTTAESASGRMMTASNPLAATSCAFDAASSLS